MNKEQLQTSRMIRRIGLLEGVSFLILLFIAMPLKYLMGIPEAVKYTGWAHGVLFVAYIYMIFQGYSVLNWSAGAMARAFIASLLPFGTLWLDRRLKAAETAV